MKDVQWVNDRQHLEEIQRQLGVNEVIMYDDSGSISEGLQTNFFAEIDGVLLTAPDDSVLSGTVRKVVLEVAKANGIPVKLECPKMGDINRWGSCFICSTSRLDTGLSFFGICLHFFSILYAIVREIGQKQRESQVVRGCMYRPEFLPRYQDHIFLPSSPRL